MSGPNPRAAAVSALVKQEQDGFSNLVLDAELKRQQLEGRDKAFASAIFYTVLEHRGTLDYMLGQFLPKGLARLDAPVREILRSALAQARYMQVPASAAVNQAVKLLFPDADIQILHTGTMVLRVLVLSPLSESDKAALDNLSWIPAGVGLEMYQVVTPTFGFAGTGLKNFNNGTFATYGITKL